MPGGKLFTSVMVAAVRLFEVVSNPAGGLADLCTAGNSRPIRTAMMAHDEQLDQRSHA
jgi:hypothetical protein